MMLAWKRTVIGEGIHPRSLQILSASGTVFSGGALGSN